MPLRFGNVLWYSILQAAVRFFHLHALPWEVRTEQPLFSLEHYKDCLMPWNVMLPNLTVVPKKERINVYRINWKTSPGLNSFLTQSVRYFLYTSLSRPWRFSYKYELCCDAYYVYFQSHGLLALVRLSWKHAPNLYVYRISCRGQNPVAEVFVVFMFVCLRFQLTLLKLIAFGAYSYAILEICDHFHFPVFTKA